MIQTKDRSQGANTEINRFTRESQMVHHSVILLLTFQNDRLSLDGRNL